MTLYFTLLDRLIPRWEEHTVEVQDKSKIGQRNSLSPGRVFVCLYANLRESEGIKFTGSLDKGCQWMNECSIDENAAYTVTIYLSATSERAGTTSQSSNRSPRERRTIQRGHPHNTTNSLVLGATCRARARNRAGEIGFLASFYFWAHLLLVSLFTTFFYQRARSATLVSGKLFSSAVSFSSWKHLEARKTW